MAAAATSRGERSPVFSKVLLDLLSLAHRSQRAGSGIGRQPRPPGERAAMPWEGTLYIPEEVARATEGLLRRLEVM